MTHTPMIRLKAYATENTDGTYSVDAQGLLADVVILAKIDGLSLELLIANIAAVWDEISVEEIREEVLSRIPPHIKNMVNKRKN